MNRVLRSCAAMVWAFCGCIALYFTGIWWERASSRGEVPDLSGWGLLFVLGVLVLLFGMLIAWSLANHNRNLASVVVSALCAVLLALGAALIAPEIGWASTLRLTGIVLGGLFYLGVTFLIAWRPASL